MSELSGPSLNRREGVGGGCGDGGGRSGETLFSSDLLFFLGLKTPTLFHQ